jgi:hypothetical protein
MNDVEFIRGICKGEEGAIRELVLEKFSLFRGLPFRISIFLEKFISFRRWEY